MVTSEPPTHSPQADAHAPGGSPRSAHWDRAHGERGDDVSWYQEVPATSLELINRLDPSPTDGVIDVGGGASRLVDHLLHRGHRDVTVLDISAEALDAVDRRISPNDHLTLLRTDLLDWRPIRRHRLWHDRAVFHFLTDERDRIRYRELLDEALEPDGSVVIATFAPDGPERCSGLEVRRHGADDLAAFLGPDFMVVEGRREIHTTPWHTTQPFTWIAARRSPPAPSTP